MWFTTSSVVLTQQFAWLHWWTRRPKQSRLKVALWNKGPFLIQAIAVICFYYRLMNSCLSITGEAENCGVELENFLGWLHSINQCIMYHPGVDFITLRYVYNRAEFKTSELRYLHVYTYMDTRCINSRAVNGEKVNTRTEWFSWLQPEEIRHLRHLYPLDIYV